MKAETFAATLAVLFVAAIWGVSATAAAMCFLGWDEDPAIWYCGLPGGALALLLAVRNRHGIASSMGFGPGPDWQGRKS